MANPKIDRLRVFAYDSINRLIASTGGPSGTIAYGLDGVGNRGEVTGGPDPGTYTMDDTTPSPADEQMNQYTTVPRGAPAGSVTMELEHDLNGNLKLIPFQADDETTPVLATATYDYRNLMVKYERGDLTAEYKYDALGRRIEKTLDDGEDTTTTLYLHRGFQEIEERDGEEAVLATYVHGNGIDEVLNMRRTLPGAGSPSDFFYHADDQGTVWAVTDAEGAVVERYDYEDYGETYVLDASGDPLAYSSIGNPSRYTGRRSDPESDLYWYRTRYYDPVAGRFLSEDSIGIWGDPMNLGNARAYLGNDPASWSDPFGESRGMDFLQCFADCLEANDPIDSFVAKAFAIASGMRVPKTFVATLYRLAGNHKMANAILRKVGSGWTTVPSAIAYASRFKARNALRTFGKYVGPALLISYGMALLAVETACTARCLGNPEECFNGPNPIPLRGIPWS